MRAILPLLLLSCAVLAADNDEGWRGVMHDVHEPAIDQAHARATQSLAQLGEDDYGLSDRPGAQALLDAPAKTVEFDALTGDWRCRSLQVDPNGLFAYPAFRCRIELTEDGTLMFTKTSGSQRRHGQLYPKSDGHWVFLGGRSVNDDPYRPYSATFGDFDGEDLADDSVGLVEGLGDGRVRMILDADGESVEFYELRR
ncbi:MAG: DUF4893 domain-containing protein [Rhodanobacteraceae bacterium]|nr:DUF4893 domain-containing protein [Rhodanobacteraceae bacterium]